MTRVSRRSASVLARYSPSWITKRKARKHRVILESVTREKKKLRSVISFEAKAPPGYTFIPAGDPHFTAACKELCRKDESKVYAVSTTPHLRNHGLSQHVHRIGYHFPSAIVSAVCMDRGLYLTATGKAVSIYNMDNQPTRKRTNSVSQITINTEARDVLKDLFPNIPENDLNQIIKTAFQKGQGKVGTAVELPLARRAQLAVVAHIRHIYTNYDRLLKNTSFHEARAAVEQPTLAKLVEWRGDDENGKKVLEDVFREVIVISDDEDSDTENEAQPFHGRDTSVEIISSNPVIEELQMRPVNHGNPALQETLVENSGDEALPGFRFISEVPKKTKIDRRGFSRYQAWDRAINRYRNITNGSSHQRPLFPAGEPLQDNLGLGREPHSRRPVDLCQSSTAPYTLPNQRAFNSNLSRPPLNPVAEHRVSSASLLHINQCQRDIVAGNPAVLTLNEQYELYPLAELPNRRKDTIVPLNPSHLIPLEREPAPEQARHSFQDLPNGPVFVNGPRETHERNGACPRHVHWPPGHLHSRNLSQQDRVLPSIESPVLEGIKRPSSGHIEHLTKRMSGAFTFRSVTPHRQAHQDLPNHTFPKEPVQDHVPKRRRVAYYEPTPLEKTHPANHSIPLNAYRGNQHTATGQSSVQEGAQARRRNVAPIEPLHIAERQPGSTQDLSISITRFDREPHVLAHKGPIKDYDGQSPFHSRLVNSQAYHKSPGQSRIASDTRYLPIAGGRDRVAPPRPADATEPRTFYSLPDHSANEVRPPETTRAQHESAWWSRNSERAPVSYQSTEKQRLYADGFVRPVDIREPGVLEYQSSRRHPSSHVVESPPQLVNTKFHGDQHRRVPPDNLASVPPRSRAHPESQAKISEQYPVVDDRGSRFHAGRLFRTPPPAPHYERQPRNNTLTPSRKPYEVHQRVSLAEEQRSHAYVRRAEDPRYPLPESRTIMIVD